MANCILLITVRLNISNELLSYITIDSLTPTFSSTAMASEQPTIRIGYVPGML